MHCCVYIPSEFWKEICLDLKLDSSEFKKDDMRLANEQSQTEYIPHARITLTDGETDGAFEGDVEGSLLGLREGD